jgi:HEAT repeats
MARRLWLLSVIAAVLLGWSIASVTGKRSGSSDATREAEQLRQQVTTLQARLHAREELVAEQAPGTPGRASAKRAPEAAERGLTAAVREERILQDLRMRTASGSADRAGARHPSTVTPTVEAALDRFYRYLEATRGGEGRERWGRAREMVEELRAMGDVAGKALMQVLAAGNDSDERRAAARLLGTLQVPQALPALKDILEKDDDVLLRRAAASGLRQLQTPESIPVMEHMLANAADDRFVRLSAAYGLAEAGRPLGVNGLVQIFNEAAADGRGRDVAFRALASLNDERPVPFMRAVVASDAEPGFRLRAIQYLTAQGDRQSLPTLQVLMHSPTEQASIRDAAAQAYRTLGGK